MIVRKGQTIENKSLMVQEGGRMSARMVSSSLNAMREIKNEKQNKDRTECNREADNGKCNVQEG